jgi:ABC-2 type transport system permease protein
LLAKSYTAAVDEMAQSSVAETKRAVRKNQNETSAFANLFLRSYESKAIWRIFRSQFRFDSKFRLALFSWLPITAMYFIIAVSEGSVRDPFGTNIKELIHANFLYLIAMLSPLLIMQQISQSESYKASWIFFAMPIDRARLVLGARNIVQIVIFIPYLVALTIALCFYMPVTSAVLHMCMLGGIAQLIFQLQMLFAPKIPFSEQRKQQKNTATRIVMIFGLMIVPLGLLFLIIYYCYPYPLRYWAALAMVATLALVFDQFVRKRLRKKLELVEYSG